MGEEGARQGVHTAAMRRVRAGWGKEARRAGLVEEGRKQALSVCHVRVGRFAMCVESRVMLTVSLGMGLLWLLLPGCGGL